MFGLLLYLCISGVFVYVSACVSVCACTWKTHLVETLLSGNTLIKAVCISVCVMPQGCTQMVFGY